MRVKLEGLWDRVYHRMLSYGWENAEARARADRAVARATYQPGRVDPTVCPTCGKPLEKGEKGPVGQEN